MPTLTPEDVLASLPSLPAFPRIVLQIVEVLDDDNASLNALVNHLQRDPVIAGRVLSAANASRYGSRSLGGVSAAVSLIGMRRVREIVLTTSLLDFSRQTRAPQFYWEHSLAVGIACRELGHLLHLDEDRTLIAGLLHDIGKLWMIHLYPEPSLQLQLRLQQQPRPLCAVEQEIFGLDHCAIGAIIARHWQLPEDVIEAIANHHQYGLIEPGPLAAVTHVAEAICHALELPPRDDPQLIEVSAQALHQVGINWEADQSELLGAIEARFQHARSQPE